MINETIGRNINALAKYIPGGLFIFNIEIKNQYPYVEVTAWNKIMEEITEYKFEEINEEVIFSMFSIEKCYGNSSTSLVEALYTVIDKKEKVYEIATKNKLKKLISIELSIEMCEDNQYTVVALVKDITKEKRKEIELNEIEERYKKILQCTTDAILIYGDEKILYVNNNCLNMLGYENIEHILGLNILDIVHPDFHHIAKARIKESREKERGVQLIEEKYIKSNGEIIDVEIQMTYIPYEGKKCNVAFVRNITERKNMERALRKSEKYFKKLFNNVNDAIYLNKIDENGLPSTYIEVNNVACNRLGYSREELKAMIPFETNPTMNKDRAYDLINELNKKEYVTYEGVAKKKNGEVIPVEISSIVLFLDEEKYILSISRDISERIKNERMLRENEMKYRQLVEALPYGIFIWDNDNLLFSNKVGLSYLGISSLDELNGRTQQEVIKPHPSYKEKYLKSIEVINKNGFMPLTEEKFIRIADNKVLDLETIITKYPYGGNDNTYLSVVQDISDRKKAEILERDMNEKSKLLQQSFEYERLRTEFFANISHELRTPINVMFTTLQLMEFNLNNFNDGIINLEKWKKHIGIMKQNCYRLVRLINNLIDVTKIDSGYFEINLENANIVSIVEDITLSVAEYIENKHISLIFDTDIEEKIMACDPDKIERIMLNLISNAVKFTSPGGNIFVAISDMGEKIKISVKDTGIGIPKTKQKAIFQRFIQVDKSLTRKHEGSGIGLSLVKALVNMHKGNITVTSEPDKGSEFCIELPVYLINNKKNKNDFLIQGKVEKIKIEFSDIYF